MLRLGLLAQLWQLTVDIHVIKSIMNAIISKITYGFPEEKLTSEKLAQEYPDWSIEKIQGKTGIVSRGVAKSEETASDFAYKAAEQMFTEGVDRASIDTLLYITQSPDYILPSTSCILQNRLGLSQSVAAMDINLGCSGYIYGLGVAKGMIMSGQSNRVLLVTADTYTKYIHRGDRSVRTLFGDGAAVTLIDSTADDSGLVHPFIYGTDGSGAENLIIPASGARGCSLRGEVATTDANGNTRSPNDLFMNGPEIFNFTLRVIPATVASVLEKSNLDISEIDLFVFHQANEYMLEHIRKRLGIEREKFVINMQECGNTVSSSIPIALKMCLDQGVLKTGMKVMLVGFGVGYSWGGVVVEW
jgi:3-oxoacyl-[acyl-carrier-protein] synthase-3